MWDVDKLDSLFDEETAMAIKKISLWSGGQKDRWAWIKSNSGEI